jgi:hypothetical protein
MIEGAAILLAGILAGVGLDRLLGRWPRRKRGEVEAACSCGHGIGYHDRETGHCHRRRVVRRNYHDYWEPCGCQRYVGPEPLPSFYAPEITPD